MAAPMTKSVSFYEKKRDCFECLDLAYLSVMERPCIYSGYLTSWTVTRGPSHWRECFLFDPISDLVQDIERMIYLR